LSVDERAVKLGRAGAGVIGTTITTSASGEVLAKSNVIMEGYWNQQDASDSVFEAGWFRTGDGGTIDTDGFLTVNDRLKDVIISGGENVSSIEVEDVIFSHPGVAEVAVIGVPHEKWGETVKALVVLAPGSQLSENEIIQHCRQHLAGFKSPTSVEFRDALDRTATGKLQKFKLREQYWRDRERQIN
jgi:acyl-CoA synthetase (AMP-forming)/AMP-acid ligase II